MRDPFFIAASARSGSHFFMSLLTSTQKVSPLKEYLHNARGHQNCTDEEVLSYFGRISENAIDGEWGTKVDIRELFFIKRYLSLRQVSLTSIRWIWLRRRDKIKQAISHLTAERTGIWHLYPDSPTELQDRAKVDMEFPIEELNSIVALYLLIDEAWQHFFEKEEITPHTVYYEDFIEESTWARLIGGVLEFLQIPYDLPLRIESTQVKQSFDSIRLSYKNFINQDVFRVLGYREKLWNHIKEDFQKQ